MPEQPQQGKTTLQQGQGLLDNITGKILNIKPGNIGRAYHNTIGSRPIAESTLLAALMGYGAYKGAPLVAKPLMRAFMPGASEREVEMALADARREGRMGNVQKILGASAGVAGAAYPFLKSTNFRAGWGPGVRSYLGKDFYSKDEPAAKYDRAVHRKGVVDREKAKLQTIPDNYSFREGSAGFQDPLVGTRIPVSYSLDLLQKDPFLREPEKAIASSLVQGSEEESGITSGKSIAQTALRAGVGFVPAYAFGKVMTGLAGMPQPAAENASLAGGIAGAIYNTGILQDMMRR